MTHRQLGAKVDPEFEARVASYSWTLSHGYARHYARVDGKVKNLFGMHELVWRLAHGVTVKRLIHINGDKLDNRLANLRPSDKLPFTPSDRPEPSNGESLQEALDFFGFAAE